jgi:hypothetical protein
LAHGCPGRALGFTAEKLQERLELRGAFLAAVDGDAQSAFDFSQRLCESGHRQTWMHRVEDLLAILEDVLRDVVVISAGRDVALVNHDIRDRIFALAPRLWPGGVRACAQAISEARDNLTANVTGRVLVDALVARVKVEFSPT